MQIAKLVKDTVIITDDHYKDPKTIPLIFRFMPDHFESTHLRMKNCSLQQIQIDEKTLYFLDGFFTDTEGQEMRQFSKTATFSRGIVASQNSLEKGQIPARSMDAKEKWAFFSKPPSPIQEFYKLLSLFSLQMKVDISTFPWDLVHRDICSPAIATNLVREHSEEDMGLDKHRDVDPQNKGIAFAIPILYAKEKAFFPNRFVNGDVGKPWLVTAMIYSTAENFLPAYRMGTAFYKDDGELVLCADCLHMRIVLFEGDIIHGVEKSILPAGIATERLSYVFKLIMNPLQEGQSVKKDFQKYVQE